MPETEPALTEVDAEHIETARLAQRQKNIALTTVAEMAHMVLGKRCVGDDDADCWVIADLIVNSEWLKDHVAAARRETLLEAAEEVEVGRVIVDGERKRAEKAEAKVARVEALLPGQRVVTTYALLAALAEPERDEESGR